MGAFATKTELIDTNNVGAVTGKLNVRALSKITLDVAGVTGTHATHRVALQVSVNGDDWRAAEDSAGNPIRIAGDTMLQNIEVSAAVVRARVSTAEGAVSTCNVTIQAKE